MLDRLKAALQRKISPSLLESRLQPVCGCGHARTARRSRRSRRYHIVQAVAAGRLDGNPTEPPLPLHRA
jgi:hypothetical protein